MGKEDVLFKHSGKRKQENIEYVRSMDDEELENIIFTRSIARKVRFF